MVYWCVNSHRINHLHTAHLRSMAAVLFGTAVILWGIPLHPEFTCTWPMPGMVILPQGKLL